MCLRSLKIVTRRRLAPVLEETMKLHNDMTVSNPIAFGLAGAILGWLVTRSRKPAKVPVRNR